MNAFFSFDLFLVYIQECKQQLRTMKYYTNTRYCTPKIRVVVLMVLLLSVPCNNQRPRCDIAWLHVTNHLYHGFPSNG